MKLRVFVQILIGFVTSWITTTIIGREKLHLVIIAVPILGLIHELLHYITLKLLKLEHRFVVKGFLIGFKSTFKNINQFIVAAATPQIVTIVLAIIYVLTSNIYTLTLSLLHVAISYEDLLKIFKYLTR